MTYEMPRREQDDVLFAEKVVEYLYEHHEFDPLFVLSWPQHSVSMLNDMIQFRYGKDVIKDQLLMMRLLQREEGLRKRIIKEYMSRFCVNAKIDKKAATMPRELKTPKG